jgi:uncharacterized protein with HEPN domain
VNARRDESLRVRDILEAIEKIERRTVGIQDLRTADEGIQVWVMYHIQVIGEAARATRAEVRNRYPEVDWAAVIGMRHRLVHDYFDIDLDIVGEVIAKDLPVLKKQIQAVIEDMEGR